MSASSLPAAKTPRLEGAALHLLPAARHRRSRPHPSARVPLGSARCSLVCIRTRPVRGERGLASQQCSRSCTPSANQLQLQCTAKTPLAGSPRPVCDARSHDPFAAPVSGAAASTRSELRHALHTARARPPGTRTAPAPPRALLPKRELTRNLRTGRFRGRRDSGVGVERRCEVRGSKKSLCTHKHRVPRAHPLPPRVTPGITDNRCPHARP